MHLFLVIGYLSAEICFDNKSEIIKKTGIDIKGFNPCFLNKKFIEISYDVEFINLLGVLDSVIDLKLDLSLLNQGNLYVTYMRINLKDLFKDKSNDLKNLTTVISHIALELKKMYESLNESEEMDILNGSHIVKFLRISKTEEAAKNKVNSFLEDAYRRSKIEKKVKDKYLALFFIGNEICINTTLYYVINFLKKNLKLNETMFKVLHVKPFDNLMAFKKDLAEAELLAFDKKLRGYRVAYSTFKNNIYNEFWQIIPKEGSKKQKEIAKEALIANKPLNEIVVEHRYIFISAKNVGSIEQEFVVAFGVVPEAPARDELLISRKIINNEMSEPPYATPGDKEYFSLVIHGQPLLILVKCYNAAVKYGIEHAFIGKMDPLTLYKIYIYLPEEANSKNGLYYLHNIFIAKRVPDDNLTENVEEIVNEEGTSSALNDDTKSHQSAKSEKNTETSKKDTEEIADLESPLNLTDNASQDTPVDEMIDHFVYTATGEIYKKSEEKSLDIFFVNVNFADQQKEQMKRLEGYLGKLINIIKSNIQAEPHAHKKCDFPEASPHTVLRMSLKDKNTTCDKKFATIKWFFDKLFIAWGVDKPKITIYIYNLNTGAWVLKGSNTNKNDPGSNNFRVNYSIDNKEYESFVCYKTDNKMLSENLYETLIQHLKKCEPENIAELQGKDRNDLIEIARLFSKYLYTDKIDSYELYRFLFSREESDEKAYGKTIKSGFIKFIIDYIAKPKQRMSIESKLSDIIMEKVVNVYLKHLKLLVKNKEVLKNDLHGLEISVPWAIIKKRDNDIYKIIKELNNKR